MKKEILILIIVASVIFLFNLGAGSLSSWDEAFYAQVSREMHDSGNWIDLTWGGQPWYDKPPLYMWVTAFFYGLFGVNEFSARLFSALAGIGLVFTVYLLSSKLFSKRTGILSAIMAMSTFHILWIARMGTLDVVFTLFTALSIYTFIKREDKPFYLVFAFMWFGLAFMTKGPGAFIVPVILAPYLLVSGNCGLFRDKFFWAGSVVVLVVMGFWYGATYMHYGNEFISGHFFQNLVTRTTGVMDGHEGGWLTYINVILYKGKPWGTLGLIAFPLFVYHSIKSGEIKSRIIIAWILMVYLVFSLVQTKLHWYIFPIYPALMVVAGWSMDKILKRSAMPIVLLASVISLVYFGAKKELCTQDYNHDIKELYVKVSEDAPESRVYLLNIHDPGMKFYFGEIGKHVTAKGKLAEILANKGSVVVAPPGDIKKIGVEKVKVIASGPGYSAVKVR